MSVCRCGAPAELVAVELPENEGAMLCADPVARVPMCGECLADDPTPEAWDAIEPVAA